MDSRISTIDKITILYRTGIKFLRGGYAESFLKNRMRYIGCSGKITIGKNVMFGPKCVCLQKIMCSLIQSAASKVRESSKKELLLRTTAGLEAM